MRSMYYDRVRTVTARCSSVSLSSLSSEILENVRNHQAMYTESMIRISRELESASKELSSALALLFVSLNDMNAVVIDAPPVERVRCDLTFEQE